MTAEERFERIEHLTASLAEGRSKDREEYKSLWRDTQRQINELATGLVELRQNVNLLAVETRLKIEEVDERLGRRLDQLAAESRAEGKALDERIAALVSAMGEYIAKTKS